MAKPLNFTPRIPTPEERLQSAVHDSGPALEESLQLLRELHEHGVLELLVKVTRGGEGLTASLLQLLGGQSGVTALRNLSELGKTAAAVDPRELAALGQALAVGLSEGARHVASGRGVGLGELAGLLRDRDVQLALGAIFGVLKGAGRALRESRGETQGTANTEMVGRGSQ